MDFKCQQRYNNRKLDWHRHMGNQCSSTQLKQQFEVIKEFEHPSLGPIRLIRSIKTYNNNGHHRNQSHSNMIMMGQEQSGKYEIRDGEIIGVKQFGFRNPTQRDLFVKSVKEANSYIKIPTLLRLLSYEVGKTNKNSITGNQSRSLNNYRCGPSYTVIIYFTYYANTLAQVLNEKRHAIMSVRSQHKKSSFHPLLPKSMKLNNYEAIDKLPHNQRKIVNMFYQEVEILRFIDYIIGALYFLNHLQHRHEAVCPENIMIDEEGKFALADAIVFRLGTNYDVALMETYNKSVAKGDDDIRNNITNNRSAVKYLSPQLLLNIKNKNASHHQSSEKAEIFSVGLIALEMCLIDYNILEYQQQQPQQHSPIPTPLLDQPNLKINKTFLNKALVQAQSRYSLQLVDLLASMLEYDPVKRINFSTLIDMLSPLLVQNLGNIQKLYNPNTMPSKHSLQPQPLLQSSTFTNPHILKPPTSQLMNKLSELQTNYQKIVNRTSVFENQLASSSKQMNQKVPKVLDEAYILEDEQRILKELKKINVGLGRKAGKQSKIGEKEKREVKGSELYDIYLSEYETIKKNRFR